MSYEKPQFPCNVYNMDPRCGTQGLPARQLRRLPEVSHYFTHTMDPTLFKIHSMLVFCNDNGTISHSNSMGQPEPAAATDGSQRPDRSHLQNLLMSPADIERVFGTCEPKEIVRMITGMKQTQLQVRFRTNRDHRRISAHTVKPSILTLSCGLGSGQVQGRLQFWKPGPTTTIGSVGSCWKV